MFLETVKSKEYNILTNIFSSCIKHENRKLRTIKNVLQYKKELKANATKFHKID